MSRPSGNAARDRTGAAGLRTGFTTGTCATAAALASALYRKEGVAPDRVEVELPDGRFVGLPVIHCGDGRFGVIKDAGDDPDVTGGLMVCAGVEPLAGETILFAAGDGVGIVTRPGLKLPVGEPAINPVPRRMIEKAVRTVLDGGARITVSIPGGEAVARRTFNPRLGVVGGLSILGTTGIVRPMSEDALKESLEADLRVKCAQGRRELAFAFGESGERAVWRTLGLPPDATVQTSNYVGHMLAFAAEAGVTAVLLTGHPGKLAKVSAGTMNTHNAAGDGRIEAICTRAALMGATRAQIQALYACPTTEAAMRCVQEAGLDGIWTELAGTAAERAVLQVHGRLQVEAMFFDGAGNPLGASAGAEALVERMRAWED